MKLDKMRDSYVETKGKLELEVQMKNDMEVGFNNISEQLRELTASSNKKEDRIKKVKDRASKLEIQLEEQLAKQ